MRREADNHGRNLYANNKAVYDLLRYGVAVKTEAGKVTETVHLINWHEPEKNDFAIAEEVTLHGNRERRPDLVITHHKLDTPGKRALYNNLKPSDGPLRHSAEDVTGYDDSGDPVLDLALCIDKTVKKVRPDGWRGIQSREHVIKAALYDILQDIAEVERLFVIIKAQADY